MGGAGPWGAPSPAPAVSPNFGLWIALGLAQLILCAGFLPAIGATILAFLSKSDWDRGNYSGALAKLRWAKVCTGVNIALGVVAGFLYVLLMMFAAVQG